MKAYKRIAILALFSLIGAIGLYLYSSANLRGSFVKWKSMGKPPGGAVHVVALDFVQTKSGDIYQYTYQQGCIDGCWIKTNSFPSRSESLPLKDCGASPSLDKFIDSKAVCEHWGPGISLTIEAIDEKGYVYSWQNKLGEYDWGIHSLSPFIGGIAGFLFAIPILLIILFFDLLEWLRKRAQQNDISGKT